ncbi:hypothetical protein J5X84_41245 [Streptosporangiaceae bacterium NEAU-GS5]|nr:hypothetical protein [Streptosporangiaceae bacterium NEAU-GS5]
MGILTWAIQNAFMPQSGVEASSQAPVASAISSTPTLLASAPTSSPASTPSPSPTTAPEPPIVVDLVKEDHDYDHLPISWVLRDPTVFSRPALDWISKLTRASKAHAGGSRDPWFYQHAAARADLTAIKLIVHGNRDKKVRILSMRTIKRCSAPLHGTLFYSPLGGASDEIVRIYFDLDKPDPLPLQLDGKGRVGGNYFSKRTISLKRDEDIVFQIIADTERYYCEFRFALNVLADGRQQTVIVDNHGQPWRVSALRYRDYPDGYGDTFQDVDFVHYKVFYVSGSGALDPNDYDQWRRWDPRKYAKDPRLTGR